jgi:diguanylate cyclase (GGDEF)-like protein/PAS domain S-box-containing protein
MSDMSAWVRIDHQPQRADLDLEVQRDFNELIAIITSRFVDVSPANLDAEIERSLQQIGETIGMDTNFVFKFDAQTQTLSMTHQWSRPGYPRTISQAQNIPWTAFAWSFPILKRREVVRVPWVADLPPEAAIDQAGWQAHNITALLFIPLVQKSEVTGFLGFTAHHERLELGDDIVRLLQVMGQTIANAQTSVQDQIALRESEARWQFALEGAGDGVWDWNAATNTVFFSRQWKAILGYEDHEIGTSLDEWDSRIHPEDKARCYEDLERHFTGQTPFYQNEHRVRCKDGSYRWILDRGKVIEWATDGQPLRVIGTHTDVTERKQAETQFQQLTTRLELAAQSASMGIWEWDIAADRLIWDERLCEIYGRKPEDFDDIFEAWKAGVHPDDLSTVWQSVAQALSGKKAFDSDFRIVLPNGTVRYIEAHAIVQRDGEGRPLRMIGVNWDITERKHAATQLQDVTERLGLAVQAANMGIWEWDIVNNRLHWDERMFTLYNIRPEDFDNGYEAWQSRVHPEDLPAAETIYQTALPGETDYAIEFRILWPDGTIRHIASYAILQRDRDGHPLRMVGVNLDISDRKQAEAQLIHNALHDGLTGLPNRTALNNRLELAMQRAQRAPTYHFAVLFLDLDQFKVINDSLGHLVGDELLKVVAQKLKTIVRPTDLAARLGGDEFVILLEHVPDIQAVIHMVERLLAKFKTAIEMEAHCIFITTSVGIVWGTQTYSNAADLLRDADIAMYRAKAKGRGRYEIFDADMHIQAVERMTLEHDLRMAIDRQEFIPYYQPIVDLKTRRLTGFEALIRWQHPVRGFTSPAGFIPIAEETGLIVKISQWILRSACGQVATWQRQFPDMADLRISINLSGQDLREPTLVDTIRQILCQTRLPATSLTLEITESMLIDHIDNTIDLLRQLKALGIRISIDDFGTGYSSLSYLYNLPADYLKIDQSFVGTMEPGNKNYKIVQAVVSLSDQLQLIAIAEGIETTQQLAWLQKLGCELGQGYLLSRPLAPEAAEGLLRSRQRVES